MSDAPDTQPNVRDAAVLLLSLGEKAAADVLKHLGPKDIARVGKVMSQVGAITVSEVSDTLSAFLTEVEIQALSQAGELPSDRAHPTGHIAHADAGGSRHAAHRNPGRNPT